MTAPRMAMRNSDLPESNEYVQLWLAVVALALEDATAPVDEIPEKGSKERTYTEDQWTQRRARLWLHSKESSTGSLEWICAVLGLSAEAVRDEYRRRLEARAAGEGQDGHRDWRIEDRVGLL
jgi:hypothetical protein